MALIDKLIDDLVAKKASEMVLSAGSPPFARVRGELVPLKDGAIAQAELEEMILEIAPPVHKERLGLELDCDFSYAPRAEGSRPRARLSCFHKLHDGGARSLAAAVRLSPPRPPTLAELGAPELLRKLADRRSGLVVVAG